MNKTKPVTPYQRLLDEIKDFCSKIEYPHTKEMFLYPKSGLNTKTFYLYDLAERTAAANQIGYEVVLTVTDAGLSVKYRKKIPVPWGWK